jgi:hypothetical protein
MTYIQEEYEDTIRFITREYTGLEKIALLQINYEAICEAKINFEKELSTKLRGLLDSRLVDIYNSVPFILNDCLSYLNLPYKSSISFKRVLANGVMPIDHICQVLDFIEKEYRPKKFK